MEINSPDQVGSDAMRIFVIVAVSVFLLGYLTSCTTTSSLAHTTPVGKVKQYVCPAYQH